MENKEIFKAAKLTPAEVEQTHAYLNGYVDAFGFYDTPMFQKLFEYFAFEVNEMPYGIAKAKTGTPDEWILERLS